MEFHLFLPQMRMSLDALVERSQAAEAAGFGGIAFMDHLAPPRAEDQPMFEAMSTAMWIAANTSTLKIGHLVLCDGFRHPAVLARQAVSVDHASGGRFELGIGAGSTPEEAGRFGFGPAPSRAARVARLAESLEVITSLWKGEPVNFEGRFFTLTDAQQLPTPTGPIPILVGGSGPDVVALASRYATWWNLPAHHADRLERLRPATLPARTSIQQVVTFVAPGADRAETLAAAQRRFGWMTQSAAAAGNADELVERFGALQAAGVERVYTWFTDFAPTSTLADFGAAVIAPLR